MTITPSYWLMIDGKHVATHRPDDLLSEDDMRHVRRSFAEMRGICWSTVRMQLANKERMKFRVIK